MIGNSEIYHPGKFLAHLTLTLAALVFALQSSSAFAFGGKDAQQKLQDSLADAIRKSDAALVPQLIAQGADPNGTLQIDTYPKPSPLLILAVEQSSPAVVEALVSGGASVNAQANGLTPLLDAADLGQSGVVQYLVAHGADVGFGGVMSRLVGNACDTAGRAALNDAVNAHGDVSRALQYADCSDESAYESLVEYLIGAGSRRSELAGPFLQAIANDDGARVQFDLSEGVSPRATDSTGRDAVCIAAAEGADAALKILVARPAYAGTLDAPDPESGDTPLMLAVASGQMDTLTTLLGTRADVNARNPKTGETALMLASSTGNAPAVNALVAAHADVNAKDGAGDTALIYAIEKQDMLAIPSSLLKAGACIGFVDASGSTAMTYATERGMQSFVDLMTSYAPEQAASCSSG